MRELLFVGLGGFIGAIARYGLAGWVQRFSGGTFPWGTLTVNICGCLFIGILMAFVNREFLGPAARLFCGIGLMGAFTTFSTFGYETLSLLKDREFPAALMNILVSIILGLIAVWLGQALVKWIWH